MSVNGSDLVLGVDWGPGQSLGEMAGQTLTTVNNNVLPPTATPSSAAGCDPSNFGPEVAGHPVLIQRGTCTFAQKVANAQAAGATGVIIFNEGNTTPDRTGLLIGSLGSVPTIPVVFTTFAIGNQLAQEIAAGTPPSPSVDIKAIYRPNADDWNVIADSPFGAPNHTLVVDAHLDSIYGAGMLDNATGSVAILDIAQMLQHTPTQNHLRFIWFGGEELGLFGSAYYVNQLSGTDYNHIGFDLDADVFGTPNYLIGVLDPAAPDLFSKVVPETFPKSVYKPSTAAEQLSINYFNQAGYNHELISPNGTDAINFNRVGIPASGMLTGQDCCKTQAEVDLFGGQTGNFDGNLGTTDGGCVDQPFRWCDNWPDNVDADNLTLMSKAFADTVERMAFDTKIMSSSNSVVYKKKIPPGHIRNEPTS
jgi:Zn-dependent M28 family amino/carboxypeptidase